MTDEETPEEVTDQAEETEVAADSAAADSGGDATPRPKRVLLIPYPKFVFMYPTLIVASVAALILWFGGYDGSVSKTDKLPVAITGIFFVVLMANTFIIVFDFPRATSLTLVFIVTTLGLGLWMLGVTTDVLPVVGNVVGAIRPTANATFYTCISIAMILMYIAIGITVRFNYWELRNNELLHHHGILSDLKRYPAPNLRVDKEINDIFEFMLLGAGRLILHPTTEKRAIVLDNILFVSDKEQQLTRMLGSIKVQIGGDSGVH